MLLRVVRVASRLQHADLLANGLSPGDAHHTRHARRVEPFRRFALPKGTTRCSSERSPTAPSNPRGEPGGVSITKHGAERTPRGFWRGNAGRDQSACGRKGEPATHTPGTGPGVSRAWPLPPPSAGGLAGDARAAVSPTRGEILLAAGRARRKGHETGARRAHPVLGTGDSGAKACELRASPPRCQATDGAALIQLTSDAFTTGEERPLLFAPPRRRTLGCGSTLTRRSPTPPAGRGLLASEGTATGIKGTLEGGLLCRAVCWRRTTSNARSGRRGPLLPYPRAHPRTVHIQPLPIPSRCVRLRTDRHSRVGCRRRGRG